MISKFYRRLVRAITDVLGLATCDDRGSSVAILGVTYAPAVQVSKVTIST